MVLRQSKRPLTFPPRPLGDMFCRSEGLIQSGTHILSYCDNSFAMKLCPPRLRIAAGHSYLPSALVGAPMPAIICHLFPSRSHVWMMRRAPRWSFPSLSVQVRRTRYATVAYAPVV